MRPTSSLSYRVHDRSDREFQLAGKAALVTGASRTMGIGSSIALALASAGADVVVSYHKQQVSAQKLLSQIELLGRRAAAVQADVRLRRDCERLFNEAANFLGRLDILVNNAGAMHTKDFLRLTPAEWNHDLDVNLGAVFHCSQLAARQMIRCGAEGRIVIISSTAASVVTPRTLPYSVAKAGAEMLARAMAYELSQHRITVNVVAPGIIGPTDLNKDLFADPSALAAVTKAIPLRRLGSPADVARAVLFAVSPAFSYVTGARIVVDGGYSLGKLPSTDAASEWL